MKPNGYKHEPSTLLSVIGLLVFFGGLLYMEMYTGKKRIPVEERLHHVELELETYTLTSDPEAFRAGAEGGVWESTSGEYNVRLLTRNEACGGQRFRIDHPTGRRNACLVKK